MRDYMLLKYFIYSLYGGLIIFSFTTLGASMVFIFRKINYRLYNVFLSIASGVMLAASIFSLIVPAINSSNNKVLISFSLLTGAIFIILFDYLFNFRDDRMFNYITSITLHNIPEGLIVGIGFGMAYINHNLLINAFILALSIGIQNFPEGFAISLPLKSDGMSNTRSFIYGTLTGFVEPIFTIIGFFLSRVLNNMMPYFEMIAAGAMFYVLFSELIPSMIDDRNKKGVTLIMIISFIIMMILDICIG